MGAWKIPKWKKFNRSLWPELKQDGPNGERKLITPAEFAAEQFVSEQNVYYWIGSGRIRGIKRGGKWYVYPDTFRESI
jgi:hypothetical protein